MHDCNQTPREIRDQEFSGERAASRGREGLHPADIKAALEKKGLSLSELSRRHGYHPSAAGRALRVPWPALERVIADALSMEPATIWPDRYDERGIPLRFAPRPPRPPSQ